MIDRKLMAEIYLEKIHIPLAKKFPNLILSETLDYWEDENDDTLDIFGHLDLDNYEDDPMEIRNFIIMEYAKVDIDIREYHWKEKRNNEEYFFAMRIYDYDN